MDLSITFTGRYRVRFDEAGPDGTARASTLVCYMQDLAWHHSEAAGLDRAWYATRGMGWLVRGLELTLAGRATYGETLTVTTRITGWRRMWARRTSEVRGADGRPIAAARIDWVLLDTTGHPIRIPGELEAFVSAEERFVPTRVDHDATPASATTIHSIVRPSDLDPMGHVNNAAYLDLLDETVTGATGHGLAAPATIRLEYLRPALPGMALASTAWPVHLGLAYRLQATGGSADLVRGSVSRP